MGAILERIDFLIELGKKEGSVAEWLERWTRNHMVCGVAGSSPGPATSPCFLGQETLL